MHLFIYQFCDSFIFLFDNHLCIQILYTCWSDRPAPYLTDFVYFVSDSEEFACNAGDLGSIPELGISPGEGNGYPLQYSCLENSMDRGVWLATVQWVTESWTWLSDLTHTFVFFSFSINYIYIYIYEFLHEKAFYFKYSTVYLSIPNSQWTSPVGSVVKESTCPSGDVGERWFNPWFRKMLWRRKWRPCPVFSPGQSNGQRSLVGHSP